MKKLMILSLGLVLAQSAWAKGVEAHDAYARATVAGMQQSGAFVTLKNTDKRDNALIGASVSKRIAAHTELHNHINDNGVMRMRAVSKIPLPAGETVALKAGSYHIMFLGLKRELKVGQRIPIVLKFQRGASKRIHAVVKALDTPAKQHDEHHGHHHH